MELIKFESPELKLIEKSKADQIKQTFLPMSEMLAGFEKAYNELIKEAEKGIDLKITEKAKRLRLDIGQVRIDTGKLKDKQKENIKLEDRAIMGVHNILVWAVKEKEDKLKEIEKHFEILEQKRLDELQKERVTELSKYVDDAEERRLSEMDEDVWNAYLNAKKQAWEDEQEAIKKAEAERIENERLDKVERDRRFELAPYAQFITENEDLRLMSNEGYKALKESLVKAKNEYEAEQEKIRLENEKIKKEREAELKLREERSKQLQPYIQFIRDYNTLISKPEKEYTKEFQEIKKGAEDHWEFERKEQIRKQKEEEEKEAQLKKEREERARLERENKERIEKEEKEKEAEQARIQAELTKGDSDKVIDLVKDLNNLKTKYSFKSKKNQKMYVDVSMLLDKIINHIENGTQQ